MQYIETERKLQTTFWNIVVFFFCVCFFLCVFFLSYFSKKTSFDISCESSAWQTIHMTYQDLFLCKIKNNVERMSSAWHFRVELYRTIMMYMSIETERKQTQNVYLTSPLVSHKSHETCFIDFGRVKRQDTFGSQQNKQIILRTRIFSSAHFLSVDADYNIQWFCKRTSWSDCENIPANLGLHSMSALASKRWSSFIIYYNVK